MPSVEELLKQFDSLSEFLQTVGIALQQAPSYYLAQDTPLLNDLAKDVELKINAVLENQNPLTATNEDIALINKYAHVHPRLTQLKTKLAKKPYFTTQEVMAMADAKVIKRWSSLLGVKRVGLVLVSDTVLIKHINLVEEKGRVARDTLHQLLSERWHIFHEILSSQGSPIHMELDDVVWSSAPVVQINTPKITTPVVPAQSLTDAKPEILPKRDILNEYGLKVPIEKIGAILKRELLAIAKGNRDALSKAAKGELRELRSETIAKIQSWIKEGTGKTYHLELNLKKVLNLIYEEGTTASRYFPTVREKFLKDGGTQAELQAAVDYGVKQGFLDLGKDFLHKKTPALDTTAIMDPLTKKEGLLSTLQSKGLDSVDAPEELLIELCTSKTFATLSKGAKKLLYALPTIQRNKIIQWLDSETLTQPEIISPNLTDPQSTNVEFLLTNLKQQTVNGKKCPHKPLLILYALECWRNNIHELHYNIHNLKVTKLISELWKTVDTADPFQFLVNDNIWILRNEKSNWVGEFSNTTKEWLKQSRHCEKAIQLVLETYFPVEQWTPILRNLGILAPEHEWYEKVKKLEVCGVTPFERLKLGIYDVEFDESALWFSKSGEDAIGFEIKDVVAVVRARNSKESKKLAVVEFEFSAPGIQKEMVDKVSIHTKTQLVHANGSNYASTDGISGFVCIYSKEYLKESGNSRYWFGFSKSQEKFLKNYRHGYIVLNCPSSETPTLFVLPLEEFKKWLPRMDDTKGRAHVRVQQTSGNFALKLNTDETVALTGFRVLT